MPVAQALVYCRMKCRNEPGLGAHACHEVKEREPVILGCRETGRWRVAIRLARVLTARLHVLDVQEHAARQSADLLLQLGCAPRHAKIMADIDLAPAVEEYVRLGVRRALETVEPI